MIFDLFAFSVLAVNLLAVHPEISVIYPRLMQGDSVAYISKVENNFIFGNVQPPESMLKINDMPVPLYNNGAFMAFLPVDWESKKYRLEAEVNNEFSYHEIAFDSRPSSGKLESPDIEFPAVVSLKGGAIRTDPKGAYYIFPEEGTEVIVDDWVNGFFRTELHQGKSVWISQTNVKNLTLGSKLHTPVAWKASVHSETDWIIFDIPISKKVLYRMWDSPDGSLITVDLFGVISHIDRINIAPDCQPVVEAIWDQPFDQVLRVNIVLDKPCWGYKAKFENGSFQLKVRRPPDLRRGVKGLHIAVDPGHGGIQNGAIGPTGLMEKEVNLKCSLKLKEVLESEGAVVTLTRSDDRVVGLTERIEIAENAGADLLISLHHNAMPDGKNPFDAFGSETYYYRSQSRLLAHSIQSELNRFLKLGGSGIAYNNLALARPSSMPAVLIEAAYIMLPEQEAMMYEDRYFDLLAKAVHKGLCNYVKGCRRQQK